MKKLASHGRLLTALQARTSALAAHVRQSCMQGGGMGLSERIAELVQVRAELVARTDELVDTRAVLVSRTDELVSTRAELANRTFELVLTRNELAGRTEELVPARHELVGRTEELVRTRAELVSLTFDLVHARETLVARSAELEQAHVTLVQRDEQSRALGAHLEESGKALGEAHACIDALKADLAEVRAALIERTARLEAALGVVAAANSKPLRWALRTNRRRLMNRIKPTSQS